MKRLLALLLAMLVLFCACAQRSGSATQPAGSSTAPAVPSVPEEPVRPDFGLYAPNSAVEQQTKGAVKYFPLTDTDYYAVEPMNDGLLLFSGEDVTTLTLLREEADPVSVELDCYIDVDHITVRICQDGLYYYHASNCEIVHLGPSLREIARVSMPEYINATPALSSDGRLAYYFNDDSLRCFDLSTGISRLLRGSKFQIQQLWGLHFDDSVLKCFVFDGEKSEYQFVSTATGELLASYDVCPEIETDGDRYFAEYLDRDELLNLFGTRGEKPQCFQFPQISATVSLLLALNGAVAHETDEYGTDLYYYDFERGTQSSAAWLSGADVPLHVTADPTSGFIWLLAHDRTDNNQALYCWDPQLSQTGDETCYVTPYYTSLEPDEAGLAQIAETAKALGEQYGVRIRVWEDAQKVQPSDYSFEAEYQVPLYEKYLPMLETALSAFPEGFLQKLGKSSTNGMLTIALVRGIHSYDELSNLATVSGVQFWNDGCVYIAVDLNQNIGENLYHEIFHVIDSYVLARSNAYDNWEDLNPEGFQYDYNYINNQFREDYQYLEGENRAFIDMYSMSFPGEDRARVMEYAMMSGNDAFFESDTMQAKLQMICKGIRAAFGLKKYTEPLLWEQYLKA